MLRNPLAKQNEPEICGDSGEEEVRGLWWRVRWSALMTAPVLLLTMGGHLPVIRDFPAEAAAWMQFVWASPVVFWVGWPLLARFGRSILRLRFNMFTLTGLGVLTAWGHSTLALVTQAQTPTEGRMLLFDTAALVTVLVLLGQLLELRARKATGSAMRTLVGLRPATALVVSGGTEVEMAVEEIERGDVLRIKPGARIPADGIITEGSSSVDESMLTGRTAPAEKEAGAAVMGGTVNSTGTFLMRAEEVGESTLLSRIIEQTAKAQASRAPVQRLADRRATQLALAVMLLAMLTFVLWWKFGDEKTTPDLAVMHAVAVLIVACPAAFGLAVPMAMRVALGRGAQLGVLVKDAETLEQLPKTDVVMLDKTSTLMEGRPVVTEVFPLPGLAERDVLACAGAVEALSEHPLAIAIVKAAKELGIPLAVVTDFQAIPGGGVLGMIGENEVFIGQTSFLKKSGVFVDAESHARSAQLQAEGCTALIVMLNEKPLGMIALKDAVKAGATEAILAMHKIGIKAHMLTNDPQPLAQRTARDLKIDAVTAETPANDKLLHVYQMKEQGNRVAYVGDSSRDAAALAAATTGIALGLGAHREAVTLLQNDPQMLRQTFVLSHATMRVIRQNLRLAFWYHALGLPLAAGALHPFTGWAPNPMIASVAMSLCSLCVILNSLRLRKLS